MEILKDFNKMNEKKCKKTALETDYNNAAEWLNKKIAFCPTDSSLKFDDGTDLLCF